MTLKHLICTVVGFYHLKWGRGGAVPFTGAYRLFLQWMYFKSLIFIMKKIILLEHILFLKIQLNRIYYNMIYLSMHKKTLLSV